VEELLWVQPSNLCNHGKKDVINCLIDSDPIFNNNPLTLSVPGDYYPSLNNIIQTCPHGDGRADYPYGAAGLKRVLQMSHKNPASLPKCQVLLITSMWMYLIFKYWLTQCQRTDIVKTKTNKLSQSFSYLCKLRYQKVTL